MPNTKILGRPAPAGNGGMGKLSGLSGKMGRKNAKAASKSAPSNSKTLGTNGKSIVAGIKKKRYRPGTVALRQIRQYQKSTEFLIPRSVIMKFARSKALEICCRTEFPGGPRFQAETLVIFQEALESYLTNLFADGVLETIHGKRITLMIKDIQPSHLNQLAYTLSLDSLNNCPLNCVLNNLLAQASYDGPALLLISLFESFSNALHIIILLKRQQVQGIKRSVKMYKAMEMVQPSSLTDRITYQSQIRWIMRRLLFRMKYIWKSVGNCNMR
jgi:histone H3/H4